MERDKLLEEVERSCAKLTKSTSKLHQKAKHSFLFERDELTVRECDTARDSFHLSCVMEYLLWAYEHTKDGLDNELRTAVENAILVACKEIQKLLEN